MNPKTFFALVSTMLFGATAIFAQVVFTNGIYVSGDYVYGNGYIPVQGGIDGQTNATVRDLAPSIGQMAGVDPDNGSVLTNEECLTLKPKCLDLSIPENRAFVIAAAQILGSSSVQISYSGTNIIFSVPSNSIGTAQLDLNSVDSRYIEKSGGTINGSLNLSQNLSVQGVISGDGAGITNLASQSETDTLNSILSRGNTSSIPIIAGSTNTTNILHGVLSLAGGDLNNVRTIGDTSRDLLWVTFGTNSHRSAGVYWYMENDPTRWWGIVRGEFGGDTLRIAQDRFSRNPSIELRTNGVVEIWTDNYLALYGSLKQGYEHNFVLGDYSHAQGYLTESLGNYSHSEGKWTHAIGESSHAEGVYTEAAGYASHASGENSNATNDNTFVWSDGTLISSTTNCQFTVHAINGIRLLGGPISGDGSALTNLNLSYVPEMGDLSMGTYTNRP